ncbi:MAG: BrnT family toxin [Burkholderiales bacterium]
MADERTRAPYNQKSPVPQKCSWPSLIKKDGGERFDILCFGLLAGRLVVVGYTPRGAVRHIFSMRKANDREQTRLAPYFGI